MEPLDSLHGEQVLIIDGMTYVQQSKVYNTTFDQFAMDLSRRILAAGKKASCVDVVFDDYRNVSIRNAERDRRSSRNQLLFKTTIVSSVVIKQCRLFLSCNVNINALITFVVSELKTEKYLTLIRSKCVSVMDGDNAFKINHNSVSLVENLKSNHEHADTSMILHAKHASNSYDRMLIASPDTNVFLLFPLAKLH